MPFAKLGYLGLEGGPYFSRKNDPGPFSLSQPRRYCFVFIDRMVAHAMELWTAVSDEGVLAHEEQKILGGINMEDLHRLDYAQVFLLML
ncbi:hypothetical protein DY000_02019315 [Brassica cretica]|uniref:Uncharacterized protein n=1 Tax=Brassica cretica TaxID=69181 RepID=A0ABQ7CRV3_BRACR|nr:hypothetical protein DY000_02019315 [Brassica cretica]